MASGEDILRALAAKQASEFNSSPFSQSVNKRIVNPVVEALMAPGNALNGAYNQVEIEPSGYVRPFNSPLMDAATNMAGVVSTGSLGAPRPANSIGMGGSDEFTTLLEQARARIAAREAKVAEIAASGKTTVRMKSPTQGFALVGPDMSVKGKFRVTYFDPQGVPNGHVELPTYQEAINRAILDGFSE